MRREWVAIIFILTWACQSNDYSTVEKNELESGVRHDTLFEGLHFGMPKAEFRARCFQLNQDSVFTDGVAAKIRYKLNLKSRATMLFFPDFADDKIVQVPATVQYDAWAPWNDDLSSDQLIEDMKAELMRWYGGNKFYELKSEGKPSLWLKVDGNRRITLMPVEDSMIKVMFKDLTVEDKKIQ